MPSVSQQMVSYCQQRENCEPISGRIGAIHSSKPPCTCNMTARNAANGSMSGLRPRGFLLRFKTNTPTRNGFFRKASLTQTARKLLSHELASLLKQLRIHGDEPAQNTASRPAFSYSARASWNDGRPVSS